LKFFFYSIATTSLIFFILLVYLDLTEGNLFSIGLGWGLAFFYIVTGFMLFNKALLNKNKSFEKMIVFAVFGRLIFMALGIWIMVKYLDINITFFIITLFSLYFIFQIFEVISLNKISKKENILDGNVGSSCI